MLSDLFPKERRTTPLALLAVAAPVGTMLAFTIGGIVNAAIGWRMTFVALGAPGLLLTVVMLLTIREPRRGASETRRSMRSNTASPTRSAICGACARFGGSRRVRRSMFSRHRRSWFGARPS